MGIYGEDDIYCEVPACKEVPRMLPSNPRKRVRLDESGTSSTAKRNMSAIDASLPNLDSLKMENEDEEMEHDSEETTMRHEALRLIGLNEVPCRALRRYMKKVAKGRVRNPWVSKVQSEKKFRKTLRNFMLGMVTLACENEGIQDCQLDQSHKDAFESIDHLNEEIIESLKAIGNFSSEQLHCARNNCQKAFVAREFANTLVSQIPGDYTHCHTPECSHTIETHDDVNYLIVEGGPYSHKLEMPDHSDSNVKVREILKSKRFNDSDDVIDELPSGVIKSLVHFYMARYFCLWAFGDTELWKKNGFTLFQALFQLNNTS